MDGPGKACGLQLLQVVLFLTLLLMLRAMSISAMTAGAKALLCTIYFRYFCQKLTDENVVCVITFLSNEKNKWITNKQVNNSFIFRRYEEVSICSLFISSHSGIHGSVKILFYSFKLKLSVIFVADSNEF